jgi:hypothetical protein
MLASPDAFVVAAPGALYGVQLELDGTMRQTWQSPLPAGVEPSALGGDIELRGEHPLEVLDRSGDQILLLRGSAQAGFHQVGSLPAGREPADLTFTDLNGDGQSDMVIADAGGDALTVWMGGRNGSWGAMRTFPVGHRPVAVIPGSFDSRSTPDLAVADSGSNAVTILYGDGRGRIRSRDDIPVGAGPTALASFDEDNSFIDQDLNNDFIGDLAVVDSDANEVRILLGSEDGPSPASVTHFPAGTRPVAIAAGHFTRGDHVDAAVLFAGSGALSLLLGDGHGHFSAQPPIAVNGTPSSIAVDDFAGDSTDDVLLTDATGAVTSVTLGDRLLVPGYSLNQASGADGVVYWGQKVGKRWRARAWNGDRSTTLAIPPSTRSIFMYPGRDAGGRREVTYVRCLHRRCSPHALRLPHGPESPPLVRVPAGCEVEQFARWRHVSAFVVGPTGRAACPAARRGLWIDAPGLPTRRVATRFVNLAGVHGTTVAWSDGYEVADSPDVVRMRVASARGPTHTLDVGYAGGDACDQGFSFGGLFDRGYLYWSGECESSLSGGFESFKRARVSAPGCRSSLGSIVRFPPFDFAVSDGKLFYAGDRGLFQVDPARIRWPREHCRR